MTGVHTIALPDLRRRAVLGGALGPVLAAALAEPDVAEILVNADGSVWIDRAGRGLTAAGVQLSPSDREAAIRLMAHAAGVSVGPDQPRLSASLPGSAARVQAMLPPVVAAPVLAIRKRPDRIHTLDDYVSEGGATPGQVRTLRDALEGRRNIIVAGGAGSGKTTLLNALLAEPCMMQSRLIVIEDTEELQVTGANTVQLLTKRTPPEVTLRDLVQDALRMRPDRIIVGEVRDGSALDVLKAWNTGHPGGLLTLHANSAEDACHRLEDLCLEAQTASPARLIASAVDIIVFIERNRGGRRITGLLDLKPHATPTEGDRP